MFFIQAALKVILTTLSCDISKLINDKLKIIMEFQICN